MTALKTSLFLGFLFFVASSAFSQQLNMAFNLGSTGTDVASHTNIDPSGNIYISGYFSGTVDFDPSGSVANLTSNGFFDAYLAKYDPMGQYQWAIKIGGSSRDKSEGIAFDADGNVIITGFFRGANIDFDPGVGVANLSSNGDGGGDPGFGGDIFVAKYNSSGQYIWAFNVGGFELYDDGVTVATDASGAVFIGGFFKNSADFDPSAGVHLLSSNTGMAFLAKYSSEGTFQWAFNWGQANVDNAVYDLKVDIAGSVYAVGFFQGTNIDFDPGIGSATLSSAGNFDVFVAKYNSDGQYQFAFRIGGNGVDAGRGIELDSLGNIYVSGGFGSSNVDFNPGIGTALLSSSGGSDAFVAKYSSSGQYIWASKFGSTADDHSWRLGTDNAYLYVTGLFSGTADMDPSPSTDNITSKGAADVFVSKFALTGEYICSFGFGSTGTDHGTGIKPIGGNAFFISGHFQASNADFDPTPTISNLSSAGSDDIFLAKYTWPGVEVPNGYFTGNTICPGGQAAFTFQATAGMAPFTIQYTDGVTIFTKTGVQSGVPFSLVQNPTQTTTYEVISIADAARCGENNYEGDSVVVTVSDCDSIVNEYTEVIAFDPCKNQLIVGDASKYNVGDTVLLIQMKGALIDMTNTSNFGTVTDYRNTGNYEFNYISGKDGDTLTLLNVVEKQYDFIDGKVQLVRVPFFEHLDVVGEITCLPWDGSKGGIVAINVQNTLTLNGNIDVSGKGFRGGQPLNSTIKHCNRTDYYYSAENNDGGQKGEGIATIPDLYMYGRGALANGGGGGNSHNSGGAGGGNGGIGGRGGYQYPSLANCESPVLDIGGRGGKQLNYQGSTNRIFMGGGGGSGHTNEQTDKPGGAGGGIIIISAGSIQKNQGSITANGGSVIECAGPDEGCANDGHSGGGAGGTILLSINNYINDIHINALGGKGANAWFFPSSFTTTGPGGGGSGGVIWYSQPTHPINAIDLITGGQNGVAIQQGNDPWGATQGQAGQILYDLVILTDTTFFESNIDSLNILVNPVSSGSFEFTGEAFTNTRPVTSWEWDFGDGTSANSQTSNHTYTAPGIYLVELSVADSLGCEDSMSIEVEFAPESGQGWEISDSNTIFRINFDTTVANVNVGQFKGVSIVPSPVTGQLNSNAWDLDGTAAHLPGVFGRTINSGGGMSNGNVNSPNFYSFLTSTGSRSLGLQPTTEYWNPGQLVLKLRNTTGGTINSLAFNYRYYVKNNDNDAFYTQVEYSFDNLNYFEAGIEDTTEQSADASPHWKKYPKSTLITGLSIPDGENFYIRWWGKYAVPGAPKNDEVAFDDITVIANPTTVSSKLCPGGSTFITSPHTGTSYQWQQSTGGAFVNISNNINFSGANTVELSLNNIPAAWAHYKYRCLVNGVAGPEFVVRITNEWTGAANSAWENAGNWSCGQLPDPNTDVVIPAGGIVVINSNVTIRSLTIGSGASVTVNSGYALTITN